MAAIHEAVLSGNLECVKLLVKHGADIMQRDEDGWTPLHMACSDGFPQIAEWVLLYILHDLNFFYKRFTFVLIVRLFNNLF